MMIKALVIGPASFPGSLVSSYIRAFRRIGNVELLIFDTDQIGKAHWIRGDKIADRLKKRLAYIFDVIQFKNRLYEFLKNKRFDFILDFKSAWLGPNDIMRLKDTTRALFFHFNADSPFDKERANRHPNLIKNMPVYDVYFIWHKGLIPKIYAKGAKRVEYLPFAWDPELHPFTDLSGKEEEKYRSDLVFIGNWTHERERWLETVADFELTIWGDAACKWGRMKKGSELFNKWKPVSVRGKEFAKVVRASKINLNFLRDQNKGSHNMRTFEVPGCGGFLLTERSEEQCEFFEEDKEIACFSTPEELREKIKFYLPRDELRRKMAEAAHRKVAQVHTYLDRGKRILEVYEEMR